MNSSHKSISCTGISCKSISCHTRHLVVTTSLLFFLLALAPLAVNADSAGLHFQRPSSARAQSERANKNFRRPGVQREATPQVEVEQAVAPKVVRVKKPAKKQRVAVKRVAKALPKPKKTVRKTKVVSKKSIVRRDPQVAVATGGRVRYDSHLTTGLQLVSHGCDICAGPCTCEPGCAFPEPGCAFPEPGCGFAEPSCGCSEPSCGICEPSCGLYEPGCGIGEPGCGMAGGCGDGVQCGSSCARPGPDYWCFPVCLPRIKDLSVWGGVQGFRGPRDFANGRSDSNFGFHEGFNLSGRAPLISLLFPQLSYQLGYQAVQSRLHGTATSTGDRSQQFVTVGLFRRVKTGLQAGVAWDLLQDDLDNDIDLQQLRYEISIKSPQGREVGFFGTNSTNDELAGGVLYETVDQYALFYRWAFGNGYESRLWGGATGDGEGLFGGEFHAPLSNRWEVQTGFNYLITDANDGLAGVSQESWNIGINLVWHLGKTAKRGCHSPYRPMFAVADNGWMFVDQAQ